MPFKMKGWSAFTQTTPTTNKNNDYTYELVDANGNVIKTITKDEYINYQNEPGTDKPTKRTTDPDPYGREKSGTVTEPK